MSPSQNACLGPPVFPIDAVTVSKFCPKSRNTLASALAALVPRCPLGGFVGYA
jgi:hypothetical protein